MSDTSPTPASESVAPKGPLSAPRPTPPAESAPEPTALTTDEQQRLDQSEQVIERGLKTFHEVGAALLDIRDGRLYRAQYATFEDYCRERWGMSQRHGNRLIEAASVVQNLGPAGPVPETERHARELAPLEPEQQQEAWQAVQERVEAGEKMTADVVRDEAEKVAVRDADPNKVAIARDCIAEALNKKYGPLSFGQLLNDARKVAGGRDITHAEGKAAIAAMMEAGTVVETLNQHGQHQYERRGSYERRVERGEAAAPQENDPPARHKPKTNHGNGEHVSQGIDACQTPPYALKPLLPYLDGDWEVWEPAAGKGRMVDALRDAEFDVIASDIIGGKDFFEYQPESFDCIVTNPPYSLKYKWLERCYALGKPFALLLPVETLGAKTAQTLFREHGISVIFMDRRINFEMPNIGLDGSNAQFPTAWFVWGIELPSQMIFAEL